MSKKKLSGQSLGEVHGTIAAPTRRRRQLPSDTQSTPAALSALLAELRETYRQRTDLHGAEKRLTLQIKAIARRMKGQSAIVRMESKTSVPTEQDGDHLSGDDLSSIVAEGEDRDGQDRVAPLEGNAAPTLAALCLLEAQAPIKAKRKELEKRLVAIAKQLPIYPLVESIHGMGALGLAIIIGEAGDLSKYANPAKLWKRMGLAVFNGKSQRRVAGAGAIEQGYNPRRRSAMWTVGDSLLKKQNPYKELYDKRKEYEKQTTAGLTPMHYHRRAGRYVEKRLLMDLWKAWRDATFLLEPVGDVPLSIPQAAD